MRKGIKILIGISAAAGEKIFQIDHIVFLECLPTSPMAPKTASPRVVKAMANQREKVTESLRAPRVAKAAGAAESLLLTIGNRRTMEEMHVNVLVMPYTTSTRRSTLNVHLERIAVGSLICL